MKKLIFILLALALLAGCGPFSPPASCVGQPSLILDTVGNPTGLSRGLLAVNIAALEALDNYDPADAMAVLDRAEALVDSGGITYAEVVAYILDKTGAVNSSAGVELLIAGADLGRLDKPLPISPCDIALIQIHLEKQRVLVSLYSLAR